MKKFVLMANRTGELMIGTRVFFADAEGATMESGGLTVGLWDTSQCDGWIVEVPPEVSPAALFFNSEGVETMFDNLGEL